jgi:hypothetical protein
LIHGISFGFRFLILGIKSIRRGSDIIGNEDELVLEIPDSQLLEASDSVEGLSPLEIALISLSEYAPLSWLGE